MQEFREGDEGLRPSPPSSQENRGEAALLRREQVGDLHYDAASYSSALDYYRSALRETGLPATSAPRDRARLHRKLADCLLQQGLPQEAAAELSLADGVLPGDAVLDRAVLQVRSALVRFRQGRYEDAHRLALAAFAQLASSDLHREVGNAQMILGNCATRLGRPEKASEFFQDALATFRRIELPLGQAQAMINLAILAKNDCRWSKALQLFSRAEAIVKEKGHSHELAVLLNSMAVLYRKMGRRAEAMAYVERGLELGRNLGDQSRLTRLRLLQGQLHIDEERYAEAEESLLEARVLAERRRVERDLALADEFLGDLMAAQGRLDEADLNYELAEKRALSLGAPNDVQAEVLRRRADLALGKEDPTRAVQLAQVGLKVAQACGERFELPHLERVLGRARALQQDWEAAREAFERALEHFRAFHLPLETRRCLVDLAHLHMEEQSRQGLLLARGRLREALELTVEGGSPRPCHIHLDLARIELGLGNYDEALLALYELERLTCSGEEDFLGEVADLRAEIESALAVDAQDASSHYQVLADLPGLLETEDADASRNLRTMVVALAERLSARRGLLAVRDEGGKVQVLNTLQISRRAARRAAEHVFALLESQKGQARPRVWTQPQSEPAWREALGEEVEAVGAAVALPIRRGERIEGVLYLDRPPRGEGSLGFNHEALAVAATYVEVLQDAILETVEDPSRGHDAPFLWEEAFENIITGSEAMARVLRLCTKVAPSPYTVLFTGETGTGKGLLAYSLHRLSPRRDRRFVSVNCAAIPETLLESELFGYVKGAFTGADSNKEGLIRAAHGGTLFLDEVGKMSLPMQAKLLHFLDSKEVRPVGGSDSQRVDVRILCASKRNLKQMVEEDLFLEDLYYRLLDFPIDVPPLRERSDDILLLARHYVERTAEELGRPAPRMTRAFATQLRTWAWPGNVRELEKTIKRTVIMAAGEDRLRVRHLPPELRGAGPGDGGVQAEGALHPLKEQVAEFEGAILQRALDQVGWNRSEAARQLKISYPTLLQKIKLYGLKAP